MTLLRTFLGALALLLLLPVAAFAQDGLAQGENEDDVGYIARVLQDNLSGAGRDVQIRGFEGALSSRATIERLTIADSEGVWLEAENLALDWNRSALLRRRIEVDALTAGRIAVLRPPITEPGADLPDPEASPFSLPELPVSIEINELNAERIEIGEFFIGEPLAIGLEGEVSLAGGEGFANVTATRIDGAEGQFVVNGAFSNATRELALELRVEEGPGGIVATRLGIPGEPPVRMVVAGTAPIDDYAADILIATDGQERITGTFTLATDRPEAAGDAAATGDGAGPRVARDITLDVSGDVTALVAPEFRDFFGDDVALTARVEQAPTGAIEVEELSISARAILLEGTARIGPDGWPERFNLSGRLGDEEGGDLRLPSAGETYVDGGEIFVAYDRAEGEEWSGYAVLNGFEQPGVSLPSVSIFADGVISRESGVGTANLSFDAADIALSDDGLAAALGSSVSGSADITVEPEAPTRIDNLQIQSNGLTAAADVTIDSSAGLAIGLDLAAEADDFGRFSGLAGTALEGSGTFSVEGDLRPLDGIFDIVLTADSTDLAIGNDMVDPLLAGDGEVELSAVRDLDGTRVRRLFVSTPDVTATGSAEITSTVASAQFDAEIAELGLVLPELSGPGTLSGRLDRDADEVATFDVRLDSAAAMLDAQGTTQPPGADYRTDFSLTADVEALAPFAELAGLDLAGGAALSVSGSVTPPTRDFDLAIEGETTDLALGIDRLDPLIAGNGAIDMSAARQGDSITLRRFELSTDAVTASASGRYTPEIRQGSLDARLSDVGLVVDGLSGPGTVKGTADQRDDGSIKIDLSADIPQVQAVIDAVVAPPAEDFRTTGTVTATLGDLAPFSDLAGRDLDGAVELSLEGSVVPETLDFDISLAGETADLALGIGRLDPLIAGDGRIRLDAARQGDRLSVRQFELSTAEITASGAATIGPETREGRIDARLSDVGLLLDRLSGSATLQGTADQAADGSVQLDLTAGLPNADAVIDAVIAPPEDDYRTTGTVTASVSDLAPFSQIAGRDLGGAAQVELTGAVAPLSRDFDIEANGATRDLELGIAQLDPLLAGPGDIALSAAKQGDALTLRNLELSTPQLSASATGAIAEGTRRADIDARVENVGLVLDGLSGPATLSATADQAAGGAVEVDLTATAPGARAVVDATVAPPEADFRTTGTVTAQVNSLAPYAPLAGRPLGGSVTLEAEGSVVPGTGAFDVALDARTADLGIGIPAVDRLLRGPGTLSASVSRTGGQVLVEAIDLSLPNLSVTGAVENGGAGTTAQYSARLADIGLFVPELSGSVTADGTARQSASGGWTISTDVAGAGGVSASISGAVSPEVGLSISGSLPLGLVNPFLEPRRLSGDASFDLALRGTSLAGLSGNVQISGGRLAAPTLGQALDSIAGSVSLSGGTAQVDIGASVPAGGTIAATGPIGLTAPFPADISIALNSVVARDPSLYESNIGGDVSLTGPLAGGARIAGTIDVGRTEIQVPSTSVGALGAIPVVEHVAPPAPVQRTLSRAGLTTAGTEIGGGGNGGGAGGGGFPLDLTIRAPGQIFVRGRGIDAELGGSLRIGGTTRDVVPVGSFELIRGRIDVLQQGFRLTEGSATLAGDFVPFLRLVAETEAEDGTAIAIILEGPANDPTISFESSPELPQDEVLARLLFGRDITEISPLQAVRLASAVNTLAGRGGGGFIGTVRERLGVDDLDITTDAAGNAALEVGTYISDNIYTDVTVNSEGETSIDLNLDITGDLTARGRASSDGETSVGVFYERDY